MRATTFIIVLLEEVARKLPHIPSMLIFMPFILLDKITGIMPAQSHIPDSMKQAFYVTLWSKPEQVNANPNHHMPFMQ